jgi:O-antigen/teichoic acid export membrane protein
MTDPGATRSFVVRAAVLAAGAQAVSSLGTVVVAVLVARALGPRGLGEFGLLFVLLTTFVSMQTAWVGDALVVLARDTRMRRAIGTSQWGHMTVALVAGPPIAFLLLRVSIAAALLFGLATAAWELEEYTRRALMAEMAFARQLFADLSYLVISCAAVAGLMAVHHLYLASAFGAMATASLFSAAFGMRLVVPSRRLRFEFSDTRALVEVARFGIWRAAQSATGYVSQVGFRYCVIAFSSLAVLGSAEAARILIAPLFVVLAAANNFLLPFFATHWPRRRPMLLAVGILCAVCLAYTVTVTAVAGALGGALYDGAVTAPSSALLAWGLVAVSVAVTTPLVAAAVAGAHSRAVFDARAAGAVAGIAFAAIACAAGQALLAPAGLAVGNLLSVVLLYRRVALKKRTSTLRAVTTGSGS